MGPALGPLLGPAHHGASASVGASPSWGQRRGQRRGEHSSGASAGANAGTSPAWGQAVRSGMGSAQYGASSGASCFSKCFEFSKFALRKFSNFSNFRNPHFEVFRIFSNFRNAHFESFRIFEFSKCTFQEYAPTAPRKRSAKAFVTQTVIPREKPARRRPHSLSSEANGKWRSSDKHDTRKEPRPRVQLRKGAWAPQVACKASCGGTEPHAMGAGHGEKRASSARQGASSARQGAAPLPPSLQLTQAQLSTPKKTQHPKFSANRSRGTRPLAERKTRPAPVRGLIQGSIRRAASVETPGRRLAAVLAGPPPWDPGGACCASHRRRSARGSTPRSGGECGRKM